MSENLLMTTRELLNMPELDDKGADLTLSLIRNLDNLTEHLGEDAARGVWVRVTLLHGIWRREERKPGWVLSEVDRLRAELAEALEKETSS